MNRISKILAIVPMVLSALAGSAFAEPSFDCVIDPSEVLKLGSPITGILDQVLVKRGEIVTRGQPVAVLESSVEAATVRLNRFRAESTARIDAQSQRLPLAKARLARHTLSFTLNIRTQDK